MRSTTENMDRLIAAARKLHKAEGHVASWGNCSRPTCEAATRIVREDRRNNGS